MPLSAQREASEHQDGLRREFALIAGQADDPGSVPARLLALAQELNQRFQSFTEGPEAEVEAAYRRREELMDLVVRVPPAAGPASKEYGELLKEADAYCRAGEELLTLAAPPRVAAFTDWVIGEFIRQIEGAEPEPWREPQA
jgi:hypothetical protein